MAARVQKHTYVARGWHLSIQLDTSGLQFPLALRLVASVYHTCDDNTTDSNRALPPPALPPPIMGGVVPPEASSK